MSWPAPTRADHETFCRVEGWGMVRDAQGRTGTHHVIYELVLPGGAVLRTRISHPPDRSNYGPAMWAHILRDQLQVDEATFWACVRDKQVPDRGAPAAPVEALPAELAFMLKNRVGLSDTEIAQLARDQAIDRLNRFWTEGS